MHASLSLSTFLLGSPSETLALSSSLQISSVLARSLQVWVRSLIFILDLFMCGLGLSYSFCISQGRPLDLSKLLLLSLGIRRSLLLHLPWSIYTRSFYPLDENLEEAPHLSISLPLLLPHHPLQTPLALPRSLPLFVLARTRENAWG